MEEVAGLELEEAVVEAEVCSPNPVKKQALAGVVQEVVEVQRVSHCYPHGKHRQHYLFRFYH